MTQTCGVCLIAQREPDMLRCGVTGRAMGHGEECSLDANDVLRLQGTVARIGETVAKRYEDSAPAAREE